jgi:hypothetical protein
VAPLAWFSVKPIRELREATKKTVQSYQFSEPSDGYNTQGSPSEEYIEGLQGDEESLAAADEAREEGFLVAISKLKAGTKRKGRRDNSEWTSSLPRRTCRIPGKVTEKKHWVYDELTDLTRKFNEMSEELSMQYQRLEERVKERTAELEQSKKAAEVANESKNLFLANISHELARLSASWVYSSACLEQFVPQVLIVQLCHQLQQFRRRVVLTLDLLKRHVPRRIQSPLFIIPWPSTVLAEIVPAVVIQREMITEAVGRLT